MRCGLGLILLLSGAGCAGSAGPLPIYVGHVATLSGPGKAAAEQALRAIRLAVKEQNTAAAQKNIRPIVVRHTDTEGNLDAFEAEAVRLVTVSRVVALLGGTSPEEVARLDKAQVPVVTPAGASRGLSDWVFFTGLSPRFQGQVLARFAVDNLHATKLVVLANEGRDDGLALAEAFTREVQGAPGKKDAKPPQATVWRFGKDIPMADWAKRLAQEKPQALLVAGSVRDLVRLRNGLNYIGPVLLGGGSGRELLDSGETNGVYTVSPFAPDLDIPRARKFSAAYRQAYSEAPDENAALAYDGARLLFEAIDQVQANPGGEGIAREAAGQLMKLKDFPGLTGSLSFNAHRQLLRPAFVVQVEKNRLKVVRAIFYFLLVILI